MIVVRPSVELALLFSQNSFLYFFPSRRLMNELYQPLLKGIPKQPSFHHSEFSEDALNDFYTKLSRAIEEIPLDAFHSSSNRNGLLLLY